MPKYELMYILSSAVADSDVPAISSEVENFLTEHGQLLSTEMLGKKKLAYPIKKTRNGFYVLHTFNMEGGKMRELDGKIRSIESIIRYIAVNLEELEERQEKDRKVQEKARALRKIPAEKSADKPASEDIKITDLELDEKIEQALESEDLSK
jgi:small subunit ribosomal protein S6